jgi:hypothetical protein
MDQDSLLMAVSQNSKSLRCGWETGVSPVPRYENPLEGGKK